MAHYAELDKDNKVINVISGVDENEKSAGETLYMLATGNNWKRTSYNTHSGVHALGGTPFRKKFAGIGDTYDASKDAFIPPQEYASWTFNESDWMWEAPIAHPSDDGKFYEWNEATTNWKEIT